MLFEIWSLGKTPMATVDKTKVSVLSCVFASVYTSMCTWCVYDKLRIRTYVRTHMYILCIAVNNAH